MGWQTWVMALGVGVLELATLVVVFQVGRWVGRTEERPR